MYVYIYTCVYSIIHGKSHYNISFYIVAVNNVPLWNAAFCNTSSKPLRDLSSFVMCLVYVNQ